MEESLVESCTFFKLVPSLETIAGALKKTANHHDYLVALLIVIMGEAGFRLDDKSNPSDAPAVQSVDPDNWRPFPQSKSYELRFKHQLYDELLDCKIVATAVGDVLVVNLCPTRCNDSGVSKTRSLALQTLKYVNPHSSDLPGRFMNLRELSHRFKDSLVTPMKGEILTNAGITNASLCGLPTELKLRILTMLGTQDLLRMSQTCREFRDLPREYPPLQRIRTNTGTIHFTSNILNRR